MTADRGEPGLLALCFRGALLGFALYVLLLLAELYL